MADSQKKKTKTKPPAPTKEEKARMKAEKEEQIALEMERLKKEKKLHDEIIAIIIIAVGIFLLLSLLMQNSMGVVGSFVSKLIAAVYHGDPVNRIVQHEDQIHTVMTRQRLYASGPVRDRVVIVHVPED